MADITIEEIRKRHANYPWPEDQSWQDIDFLLAKLEKRDQELEGLKAENRYICPHWSEPPQHTPIELLDKMGHALASLTSQDIDEKGKEVWRQFWQLDERLRVGQQPEALRVRAQQVKERVNG